MPILVDEYYAIKLTIENNEENSIGNIWFVFEKIEISLFFNFLSFCFFSLTTELQSTVTGSDIDAPIELTDLKTGLFHNLFTNH
jgi:hypothetical protein